MKKHCRKIYFVKEWFSEASFLLSGHGSVPYDEWY